MGCCKQLFLVSSALTVAFVGYVYHTLTYVPELPPIELDRWWGPGKQQKVDTSIRPFKIQFKDEMVADLKDRLSSGLPTESLEGVAFEYGFNSKYLEKVVQFWGNQYNFSEREAFLNKYPHFITNIQGLDIHFIHVKPKASKDVEILPLLLLHGWPGSVREFYEMIPLLTLPKKDYNFVFELIIPSLPGYGFSQAASKPGLGINQVAILMRNLMNRLGYKKYYLQGGDWGSHINQLLSIQFPTEVLAMHTNMAAVGTGLSTVKILLGSVYPSLVVADEYRNRMYPLTEKFQYLLEELGYLHLQATKPDTVGVALRDSPTGLAAYILEKFAVWTNRENKNLPDGGLTKKFKLTDLLDNLMIYWSTGSITTSMRLYAETINKQVQSQMWNNQPVMVPVGVANFKHELTYQPEWILKDRFKNLIHVSHFDDGGHFAGFELPQQLADDIWLTALKARQIVKSGKGASKDL